MPDWGLKKLVFTETTVKGPAALAQVLPQAAAAYYRHSGVRTAYFHWLTIQTPGADSVCRMGNRESENKLF
jgi:hypothetical protein